MILEPWRRSVSPHPFSRPFLETRSQVAKLCQQLGLVEISEIHFDAYAQIFFNFFLGGSLPCLCHFLWHVIGPKDRPEKGLREVAANADRIYLLISSFHPKTRNLGNHIWLLVQGPMTRFVWRSCFNCVAVCWALKIGDRFDRRNGHVARVVLLKRPSRFLDETRSPFWRP